MRYTHFLTPIPATREGLPVIVSGAYMDALLEGSGALRMLVIDGDGRLSMAGIDDLVMDVRFREGKWHDVAPKTADATD